MTIYTSYFGKKLPADVVGMSIALWPPRWWTGARCSRLAPSKDILLEYKSNPDEQRYTERFKAEILADKDPTAFREKAEARFGKDAKIVLLCYERPGQFCHRHIVAEWLGPDVSELQ